MGVKPLSEKQQCVPTYVNADYTVRKPAPFTHFVVHTRKAKVGET